jgi:hypothetical protein
MKDILTKLADLNQKTKSEYLVSFFSDGSGFLKYYDYKIPFISIQDCREKMYRIILTTK